MASADKPGGRQPAPKSKGGRPSGAKSKHTMAREREMRKAAKKIERVLGEGAFDGDAHALLMTVYKNPLIALEVRIDAAGKAIRYEKPALQAIQHTGNVTLTHEQALKDLAGSP